MIRFLVRMFLELISIPGIIVHELGHQVFCWITGTRVLRVCYFRFGLPPGYVVHERPSNVGKHLLIAGGPLVVNSMVALAAGVAAQRGWITGWDPWKVKLLLVWLGIAIGMHACPSLEDANNAMEDIWRQGVGCLTRVVATPFGVVLYLAAFARWIWLDVAWGVALTLWLPRLLGR